MVDPETGQAVDKESIGRGYEIGKGQYIEVEDEEIEKIRIESTHTIDIDTFVPRSEVDDRYLDSPYYLAPTEKVGPEHLQSFGTRSRRRVWLHLVAWCWRVASTSSC